nr:immunoglobulin heavy chain junction region [Macaca mulatta]MOV53434.1 immunoglobulin heavy chain junction region [Macaca mulatta]MOV53954.1 immunoglobulin heavy chain junction region [Macaca mulatta]MOV53992.1 immunoglobulin heavy chain junction region [Macaca mulatta]MOV54561.1 immunoglobulin heavy chain junction region [Macaca mulatta]
CAGILNTKPPSYFYGLDSW